ncbi:hypothetical protein [Salinisphaera sp.]|uniref:hypothetical protein n=1 Tax=Salinisphaera sp. TaxID=1914330 RepID=UPI000C5F076A|nr:hypothetical protein [Salinisphaera sp.]MAS09909.1 hypothetical protein [Salinisphaera sp.]MAS09964.1 hypothetical protein [Salinisphaera sp.]|tara:strand:+ start:24154 stop:24384 length:231 start_codon:yes stop_codon:yes gene_type:complete
MSYTASFALKTGRPGRRSNRIRIMDTSRSGKFKFDAKNKDEAQDMAEGALEALLDREKLNDAELTVEESSLFGASR